MEYKTMTFEEYAKLGRHPMPYIFELEGGLKHLIYFGAKHSHNPTDPMFVDIVRLFKELNPTKVLVEGIDALKNQDKRDKILKYIQTTLADEVIKEMGEPSFTLKLALEIEAEVESPEPLYEDEIKNLLDSGFSKDNIFAYYIYRQIRQYHRTPEAPPLEEYLDLYLKEFKEASKWNNYDYSYNNLLAIGGKIWGADGDPKLNKPAWADPIKWTPDQEHWTEVNLISQQNNYFRDRYILDKIAQSLKKYDRLFVIFGASHAVMQESALREIMKNYE